MNARLCQQKEEGRERIDERIDWARAVMVGAVVLMSVFTFGLSLQDYPAPLIVLSSLCGGLFAGALTYALGVLSERLSKGQPVELGSTLFWVFVSASGWAVLETLRREFDLFSGRLEGAEELEFNILYELTTEFLAAFALGLFFLLVVFSLGKAADVIRGQRVPS